MGLFDWLQSGDKLVGAALLLIENKLLNDNMSFSRRTAVEVVLPEARNYMRQDAENISEVIAAKKTTPEAIAWRLVYEAAKAHVSTGRYHFGRGVLNDDGRELRRIHDRALIELVKLGIGNDEEVKVLQQQLDEHLRDCG
jgi:hypothetical protein